MSSRTVNKRIISYQEENTNKLLKLLLCIDDEQETCDVKNVTLSFPIINVIVQASLYSKALCSDSYVLLSPEHQDILNQSWDKKMYLKGASVQLCADVILVDGSKALIIDCIEIYSRLPVMIELISSYNSLLTIHQIL